MKKAIIIICLALVGLTAYFFGVRTPTDHQVTFGPIKSKELISVKAPKLELPAVPNSMPDLTEVDDVLYKVLGFDDSLTVDQREELVSELRKRKLSKQDFQAMYYFLRSNPDKPGNQLGLHSLKNTLLVFTIEDGRFKESTGQMMLDIINEPSRHKVMREYTLQYTVDFFEKHWKNSPLSSKPTKLKLASVSDQNLQKQFIKTMWNMLDSADGPIAGTSLIRLHDIGKSFSIVDQDKLADKIQRIVTDDLAADSTKMAALSLAAERQQINLADSAMNIAVDNSLNLPLRMSALHTASQLNSSSDFINRIRRLSNDNASHRILRRAAQQILNKLNTTRG